MLPTEAKQMLSPQEVVLTKVENDEKYGAMVRRRVFNEVEIDENEGIMAQLCDGESDVESAISDAEIPNEAPMLYECAHCDEVGGRSVSSLRIHIRFHHPKQGVIIRDHRPTTPGKFIYACPECPLSVPAKAALDEHFKANISHQIAGVSYDLPADSSADPGSGESKPNKKRTFAKRSKVLMTYEKKRKAANFKKLKTLKSTGDGIGQEIITGNSPMVDYLNKILIKNTKEENGKKLKQTAPHYDPWDMNGVLLECTVCSFSGGFLGVKDHLLKTHPDSFPLANDFRAKSENQRSRVYICPSVDCPFATYWENVIKFHVKGHRLMNVWDVLNLLVPQVGTATPAAGGASGGVARKLSAKKKVKRLKNKQGPSVNAEGLLMEGNVVKKGKVGRPRKVPKPADAPDKDVSTSAINANNDGLNSTETVPQENSSSNVLSMRPQNNSSSIPRKLRSSIESDTHDISVHPSQNGEDHDSTENSDQNLDPRSKRARKSSSPEENESTDKTAVKRGQRGRKSNTGVYMRNKTVRDDRSGANFTSVQEEVMPKRYMCSYCDFFQPTSDEIRDHLNSEHAGKDPIVLDRKATIQKKKGKIYYCGNVECSFSSTALTEREQHVCRPVSRESGESEFNLGEVDESQDALMANLGLNEENGNDLFGDTNSCSSGERDVSDKELNSSRVISQDYLSSSKTCDNEHLYTNCKDINTDYSTDKFMDSWSDGGCSLNKELSGETVKSRLNSLGNSLDGHGSSRVPSWDKALDSPPALHHSESDSEHVINPDSGTFQEGTTTEINRRTKRSRGLSRRRTKKRKHPAISLDTGATSMFQCLHCRFLTANEATIVSHARLQHDAGSDGYTHIQSGFNQESGHVIFNIDKDTSSHDSSCDIAASFSSDDELSSKPPKLTKNHAMSNDKLHEFQKCVLHIFEQRKASSLEKLQIESHEFIRNRFTHEEVEKGLGVMAAESQVMCSDNIVFLV